MPSLLSGNFPNDFTSCTEYPKMPAMGIKVAVIGGGSTYTPELVEGLALRRDVLPVDELVLHDIDERRLAVVGGLAGRILEHLEFPGRLVCTTDRRRAVEGASFVLVQLRVGGMAARLRDETIPLRFGCIGQETTGPGGFAKALRTVPVVLGIAADVDRLGAPGAWLLDFTNPAGLVTQALLDHGHRAIGLCNVPIGFQRDLARRLDVAPERVRLEHVGLNHLSWERKVLVDGVDRLPALIAEHAQEIADDVELPVAIVRLLQAIPSYYLRYYYLTAQVLRELQGEKPRAEEVMEIERGLLKLYADPALVVKPKLLEERGGAFYSEASAMLIESLYNDRGDVQVVNVLNQGALPGMADDDVIETACRIDGQGAHPLPLAALAPEMHGLVTQAKAYERLAARAAEAGDRDLALKALMANPLARDYDLAGPLLKALLEANRAELPAFFTSA
jgi:6-phospho-beta-glucosidase